MFAFVTMSCCQRGVWRAVRAAAPSAVLEKEFDRSATYTIDKSAVGASGASSVKFSALFDALRQCRDIVDFSLQDVG